MTQLRVGQRIHGFVVEDCQDLPEIDGVAYVLRHEHAGTPLLWLENDDPNKAFAIAFKTPPADDTGVFHILEHSVLCGSDRYPVKEPFVNLLKTSMQTFLNALTFSDKTMYPVASTNEKDLLNLMDVYMDAVLHPALYHKREVFEQEGWHLELDGADAPLRYNGVVLNEMKGALSDPDDVALGALNRALFPDTAYGFESGGNPRAIPSLTYEAYMDAHRRHYSCANARIVLYGNVSLEPELALLDERYLAAAPAPAGEPNPLEMQKPQVTMGVIKTMDTTPDNACVMVGYVLGTFRDRTRVLAADVLADALMGSNEAPLKSRLLAAGLGDDVDAFLYDGTLQPYLVFELRGADRSQGDVGPRFVAALEEAVRDLVDDGIPRQALEASLESVAFSLRERDLGQADGVVLSVSAMSGWLYDDAMPLDYLRYEDALARLREMVDDRGFEGLLRTLVLESAHKAQVELVPEPDGEDGPAAQEARELAALKETMSCDQVQEVIDHTQALHALQAAPDTPEQVATLPVLGRDEVGAAPAEAAYGLLDDSPVPCLYHEVATRRVDYAHHYFDLSGLTWEELPQAALLASLLGKLGTAGHTACELDTLIEARLGRLTFTTLVREDERTGEPLARLAVSASSIEENVADLAAIPSEVWSSTDFSDLDRIQTILTQQRLGMEQSFAASGHTYALGRALAGVSRTSALAQRFGGLTYYSHIRDLLDHFDERADALPGQLADLAGRIFTKEGLVTSFAGDKVGLDTFWAHDLIAQGPAGGVPRRLVIPEPQARREAFVVPADVCFVAQAAGPALTHASYSGTWEVASRALSYGYLWDQVRVQGGAYGVGLRMRQSGALGFYSFRDPHLDETLARLAGASAWLGAFAADEVEMGGYVVSTVAGLDAPKKPRVLVSQQDADFLGGRDPSFYREIRSQELACQPEDLRKLAPALEALSGSQAVCVFGSRQIIEGSKADLEVVNLLG